MSTVSQPGPGGAQVVATDAVAGILTGGRRRPYTRPLDGGPSRVEPEQRG
jgi:hypothetical protein